MLKKLDIVDKLVILNVAIFLIFNILKVFFFLFGASANFDIFLRFFCVPTNLHTLLFRIWTPLTYMFLHISFMHILFNMLILYFMGKMLLNYIAEKNIVSLYLLGGFSGALMFVLSFNLFPVFSITRLSSTALGASAAITAIFIALATYKPHEIVYFWGIIKVKLYVIAIIIVVIDIISLTGSNSGGHFAHLGGGIYGFIYGRYLRKGKIIDAGFANFIDKIINLDFSRTPKIKVIKNELNPHKSSPKQQNPVDVQQRLDEILDKISKKGYQSLSKDEKKFLNKYNDR